jgi:hypothetical protein
MCALQAPDRPLKLEIAAVEHGATKSDRDYVIQFVV